jgi:hypothetical protein
MLVAMNIRNMLPVMLALFLTQARAQELQKIGHLAYDPVFAGRLLALCGQHRRQNGRW